MVDSKKEILVQLADLLCGVISKIAIAVENEIRFVKGIFCKKIRFLLIGILRNKNNYLAYFKKLQFIYEFLEQFVEICKCLCYNAHAIL